MQHPGGWRILALLLCVVYCTGLVGCSTGGSRRTRGSLSDAVAEAAEGDEDAERDRFKTWDEDDETDDDEYVDEDETLLTGLALGMASGDSGGSAAMVSVVDRRRNISTWMSRSQLAGDAIQGFSTITALYSETVAPSLRVHGGVYYAWGDKGTQQYIQDGISKIFEIGGDLSCRSYLTPDHTVMGFYLIGGIRVGMLHWLYTNDLVVPNEDGGTDTIGSDWVAVYTPYIGLGTSLLQTSSVHVGVNVTTGFRISDDATNRNFDNDVFKNIGETRMNMEASVFF